MTEKNSIFSVDMRTAMEELGQYMPGGFFIYKNEGEGVLLYANQAVFDIYGCENEEEFRELTGYTFNGMVYAEDREKTLRAIQEQTGSGSDKLDHVEYRILRKDNKVRYVDEYGHYLNNEGEGVFYVFISDVTDIKEQVDTDMAMRNAVIEALSESYHTVWLITDIETGEFSLYRGEISKPVAEALKHKAYPEAMTHYVETTVAESDRERMTKELSLENLQQKLAEKPQFNVNYLRIMDDGSEHYFRSEFARMNMPDGKTGVVCGFKDIDEEARKDLRLQNELQEAVRAKEENRRLVEEVESAAKLAQLMGSVASLLTNIPAMSFSKDAETGRYLACNQSFAEYAHKNSPEEVVGLSDHEIFDKETADHFVEDDEKAIAMDEPYIFFEDVPDAAGNPRSFQTTKIKFTDSNGRLCTLGMCVDVTEMTRFKIAEAEAYVKQQELEEKIALQEKLLNEERQQVQQRRMITALASDYWSVYYVELDRDRGICYQSHSDLDDGLQVGDEFDYLQTFTDYADQYITDEYREEYLRFIQPDAIREGLKSQRVISIRYMVKRHGRESYEMMRFAGVRHPEDRDDHIVHSVGACITDVDSETRHSLEQSQALSDALKTAEQANVAKTAFLSNMSHEIRTPMNAIIGLNNIALNDPELPDRTAEYLYKIDTSAHHLLNIINDILDMSRIESGRMVIKNEEFSFSKALEQVNTMISGQCREKGLDYECRIKGHVHDYYIGDDMKLRQVMINILGNAVKFTPAGGSVLFTVEEIANFDNKATLRMVFKDTGIGMSEEYLPRLFDAFTQEDSSSTSRYGSTGLGMPITKSIVELMNGTIDVESEKGKGTTFTVTVTLSESERGLEQAEYDDEIHPDEMTVLVVDDDEVALEHAGIVLGKTGISCETAKSGAEAVEKVRLRHARREFYNLILMDWRMPEMDGIETTRQIRAIAGNHTPIIILTSYNWEEVADEARNAGVDSFVPKPLFANTVLDEFREVYRRKNDEKEAEKADLSGKRILLAEDMAINAEIMMMVLSMRDLQVDLAENGKVAVELFENHEEGYYDAILMDMRMPEMDGLEATRIIRAMDRKDARTVPIIALTANAFDEDVQRSMQAGLNAHLSKPVEPEALFDTLESLIAE